MRLLLRIEMKRGRNDGLDLIFDFEDFGSGKKAVTGP